MTSHTAPRLGLLGGTFDPAHVGHLRAALVAKTQAGLDHVSLVVAHDPWQKTGAREITRADVRLEMVQALVDGVADLSADDREIRRGGLTYTVDTLVEIHAQSPQTDLFVIVGADTAKRINTWHRYEEVLALSSLVIVNRDSDTIETPAGVNADKVIHVTMSLVDVSSTMLRQCVARGESIRFGTTPEVEAVIAHHHLYQDTGNRS